MTSMDAPKFEYFLGHQKSATPKRLIITGVFEEKSMTMLEDEKV